ncbi:MAG: YigZ family protein [Ignavibacteriae bacterium]|nr:YigZ family protein [Ignavibacteriota bacterium]
MTNKIKVKGSQFIGYAFRINSADQAEEEIKSLKKEFYDATHHCYAYKTKEGDEKFSDDGEPNGTAGIRILNSVNHFNLTDILVVVIRYFGGTKLGVGPLGKAYGETAQLLLNETKIIELSKFRKINITYEYDSTSAIHYLLNKYNCQKIENLFTQSPIIQCFLKPNLINDFKNELIEKTGGKATFTTTNSNIYLNLK